MAPPPPPPPPPPREMLIKGTSMGRRQDVGQPGTGAPRKWSPVQIDQPRQKERDFAHTGFKLPELVLPDSDERSKKKVFRFLQPPTSGPEEAPSSVCRVDQTPPSAADDSPLTGGSQLRQPGKLPKVAGTAGLTLLEELKLRSNMQQLSDQETLPGSQWIPQPGWPLPNMKPNSRGLIPPAPPFRDRTRDTEHKISGVPQTYDLFVGSQNVIGLNEENFDDFISQKELAMIMFYDPFNPNSLQPKEHFKKAADTMGSANRQFAAVDCNVQQSFCASQGVTTIPTFKIYSLGKVLSTIREVTRFGEKEIREYMTTLSDMRQPQTEGALRQPQKECYAKMPGAQESKCSLAKRLGFKK